VHGTLVADRGLPSAALLAQVHPGGTDCSGRWRWRDWVTGDRGYAPGRAPLTAGRLGGRPADGCEARLGRGPLEQPLLPAAIVVRAAVVTPPRQPQPPGPASARAHRATQPAQHRQPQPGRTTQPPSARAQRAAQPWGLCTTAATVAQAVAASAGRMASEATDRDGPQHGAGRAAVGARPPAAMGARLLGIGCLAETIQMPLGQRVSADPVGQRRRAPGTVTDRVRGCWGGQRLCDDPGDDGTAWLAQPWERLEGARVPAAAMPAPAPTLAAAA